MSNNISELLEDLIKKIEDDSAEFKDFVETYGAEPSMIMINRGIKNWIREIKIISKTACESQQQNNILPFVPSHRDMIEQAKKEFRGKLKVEPIEEEIAQIQVEMVGYDFGDDIPTHFAIDANMPIGTMPVINGNVFIYKKDGKLHYSADETEKFRKSNCENLQS